MSGVTLVGSDTVEIDLATVNADANGAITLSVGGVTDFKTANATVANSANSGTVRLS
ncbi:hypothetical protein [Hankyongella ginsenosidimutans]|uniref:hypothetical protein n=1 Tax=Hankyongella ginsenosidimutans TaxID=1763828 RepID=UPI001CA33D6A|nr:hypothetical protein [Hankyongella ginsenosidimutans]